MKQQFSFSFSYGGIKVKEEVKVCPICNKKYLGFPAISRKDNVTKICPKCGADEAIAEFIKYATAKMRKANH